MTKTQVEVITSVQRRRRWTEAQKERLVAASLAPGAVVSALAREAGLHPSQLYKWRRQLCARQGAASGFAPVQIVGETAARGLPAPVGVIEIELAGGTRLRITGAVDAATRRTTRLKPCPTSHAKERRCRCAILIRGLREKPGVGYP